MSMFDDDDDDDDFNSVEPPNGSIEFYVYGIIPSEKIIDAYNIVLKDKKIQKKMVSITIGSPEAQSIAIFLESVKEESIMMRPLTHDLFVNFLEKTNKKLLYVILDGIDDAKNGSGIVYSSMIFEDDVVLDSRPSDSISISLRLGVPIYIAKEIIDAISFDKHVKGMEKKGDNVENYEFEDLGDDGEEDFFVSDDIESLPENITIEQDVRNKLEEAIKREDYETAARLRDMLNNM